jgi:alanyl-tRNA synthetase
VTRIAGAEERDFAARIRAGLERVDRAVEEVRAGDGASFPGDVTFELHDTFGFPVDLTAEIAEEAGLSLDRDRFDALMDRAAPARPRRRPRRAAAASPSTPTARPPTQSAPPSSSATTQLAAEASIGAMRHPDRITRERASEGDEVELVLARTPFYAEGGGQVGDRGDRATPETGRLQVLDTVQAIEGVQIVHRAVVEAGEVHPGPAGQARRRR